MLMERWTVIINPVAGGSKRNHYHKSLEDALKKKDIQHKVYRTKGPLHAAEIAENISRNSSVLIIVGGDGTISEVINGICRSESKPALGILPTGSGNDTIKSLGIKNNLDHSIKTIINGRTKTISVGRCNRNRYFVNIMGVGFDGSVMSNMWCMREKDGKPPKKVSYNRALLKTILHYKSLPLKVKIDNKKINDRFFMLSVANGTTFGGDFIIAPMAEMNSPELVVVSITDISKAKFFWHVRKVKKGIKVNLPQISYRKAKRILIESKDIIHGQLDGECFNGKRFDIEVLPNKLKVLVPK